MLGGRSVAKNDETTRVVARRRRLGEWCVGGHSCCPSPPLPPPASPHAGGSGARGDDPPSPSPALRGPRIATLQPAATALRCVPTTARSARGA